MSSQKTAFRPVVVFAVLAVIALTGCKGKGNPVGGGESGYNYDPVTISDLTWTKNVDIETSGSRCYDNSPDSCAKYGRLYTWEAAVSVCEGMGGGWRLPTNEDWDALISHAGGMEVAGKKLKSKTGWISYVTGEDGSGTDDYGFSALPGGRRTLLRGELRDNAIGDLCVFWSATEDPPNSAYYFSMDNDYDNVYTSYDEKAAHNLSVRCVQDAP